MLGYWIWLSTRPGVGPLRAQTLLSHFGAPEAIYMAGRADYAGLEGFGSREVDALMDKSLDRANQIAEQCAELDIHILTYQDAAYPERLRNIDDPPTVLYYKGTMPNVDAEPVIGVVGARKGSAFGFLTAKRLGYQIAACGGLIVSGLAEGIDSLAMSGAVSANRPVIGVLGCGADVIYPKFNRSLFEDVQSCGCLLSEYVPGTPPERHHFPARNRIISGLSKGVLVVEASAKSGALITARRALDQGRDLFAVPGNVGQEHVAGSNRLLKEGAYMVENGWDVMQEYLYEFPDKIKKTMLGENLSLALDEMRRSRESAELLVASPEVSLKTAPAPRTIDVDAILGSLTPDEAAIVNALRGGTMVVDDLIEACQLPTPRVLASLTLLEVKKYVRRLPARRYALAEIQE